MKLYEVELFIKICLESKGKSGSKVFKNVRVLVKIHISNWFS